MQHGKKSKRKKMIKKNGRWKLVQVKDVFTDPGLNDLFLVSHDLGL